MKAMRNIYFIVNEQKKERRAKEEHERSARFLQSRQGSRRTVRERKNGRGGNWKRTGKKIGKWGECEMKIKKETAPVGTESTQDNYTTAKENIKYLVEMGTRDNPVLRKHLQVATGYTDRQNRAIIEDLRKDGMRICSTAQKGGYWIARSEKEYKAFRTEYLTGAYKRLETVKAMDEFIEEQIEMED